MELVLGTVQLGLDYGINNRSGKPSDGTALGILEEAWNGGVRLLDTASAYGNSEELIGEYHRRSGNRFGVVTKLRSLKEDELYGNCYDLVRRELKSSLEKLRIEKADYYFFHNFQDYKAHACLSEAMGQLKEEGLIGKTGVSLYEPAELEYLLESAENPPESVQIPLNILDRRWMTHDLLKRAKGKGIEIFARSAFLQGLLFAPDEKLMKISPAAPMYMEKLRRFCMDTGCTIEEAAFGFVESQEDVDRLVVGCETITQLRENIELFVRMKRGNKRIEEFSALNYESIPVEILDPRKWPRE